MFNQIGSAGVRQCNCVFSLIGTTPVTSQISRLSSCDIYGIFSTEPDHLRVSLDDNKIRSYKFMDSKFRVGWATNILSRSRIKGVQILSL